MQGQNLIAPQGHIGHRHHRHYIGTQCTQGSTHHPQMDNINKKVIERHVEAAHHNAQHTGYTHVARTLEHGCHEMIKQYHRQCERKDEKISRGIGSYVVTATQPIGQRTVNPHTHQTNKQCKHQTTY